MKKLIRMIALQVVPVFIGYSQLLAQDRPTFTENCAKGDIREKTGQNVRVLFWNVENLFDYKDDTVTADEDFTSRGIMHWTYTRLQTKLFHMAKTILAAGEWSPPVLIGLCEVENRYVLNKLVYESPLKPFGYRIIHRNSPDSRGIDVALLYRSDRFIPVHNEWITIRFPVDSTVQTREILYVKGILTARDTIHLFVNHWPSRRGGEAASAPRRNYVAGVLRGKVDSLSRLPHPPAPSPTREGGLLFPPAPSPIRKGEVSEPTSRIPDPGSQIPVPKSRIPDPKSQISDPATQVPDPGSRNPDPYILIMGDFNDEPENESLLNVLGARLDTSYLQPADLVNLMYLQSRSMGNRSGYAGSHKFREHWGMLDQIIVSGSLLERQNSLYADPESVTIFKPAFLLEDDLRYLDKKPKRTYLGPRYKGGFSDHLPVYVDIKELRDRFY